MRGRILDLSLILGLVVVAGGIMWTLFNLGSPPRSASSNPPPTVVQPSPPPAPARSVDAATGADAAPAAAESAEPTTPPSDAATASTAASEPTTAAAVPAAAAAAAAAAAPPRVLPSGVLALERVGFSYANGASGACGFVLEAWTHVAVSRDLLAEYGCGAEVRVTLDDPAGGRSEMLGIIGDTMNPSFTRTVNVYISTDEDAFAYGLTEGTFSAR
jgi:3D (Asp-Asp-Asp) domain-containing protein